MKSVDCFFWNGKGFIFDIFVNSGIAHIYCPQLTNNSLSRTLKDFHNSIVIPVRFNVFLFFRIQ